MTERPSAHVLDLFAVPEAVDALPGSGSVLAGDLVLSPGRDAATADWLSPVLARLAVRIDERPTRTDRAHGGLRIAVPVPARDGSWVVEGWGAARYEPGSVACDDLDVVLATAHLLHAELAVAVPERPAALDERTDRWALAERLAFGPSAELGRAWPEHQLAARVAAALTTDPLGIDQLVHADLEGNVLLDVAGTPVVIDFSPAWRPAIWAEAVCAIDAVVRGTAAPSSLQRWSTPDERQAVLRAVAFRLASDPPHSAPDYSSVMDSLGL